MAKPKQVWINRGCSYLNIYKHLKPMFWPNRWFWAGSVACMVLATVLQSFYPRVLGQIIDRVITGGNRSLLLPLAGLLLGLAAVRSLSLFAQNFLADRFGIRSVYAIRDRLYAGLQQLSFAYYDSARTGDLMSRVTADTEAVRHFLSWGPLNILGFFVTLTVGLIMGAVISWKLMLVTLIASPVLAILVVQFTWRNRDANADIRLAQANLGAVLQEGINGIRTIKSYAREGLQYGKVEDRSSGYVKAQSAAAELWSKYFPLMELWAMLTAVVVLGFGGWMVVQGNLTLGELVAYTSIQWQIMGPLWNIGGHINNLTNATTATDRLVELFHQDVGVQEAADAQPLPQLAGHVRFEDVSFTYGDGEVVLDGITLDAPPGSVTGIMGLTGSGKSTLVSLVPRFYDVKQGRVTIDGHDVRQATLASLRAQVGVVFQETFLFSASVKDNIAYGRPEASMDEIIAAATLAQAHDFIAQLPQGYETVVGERGVGLSGGQKQRIAIARALLQDPRILIFDDATAAVDAETEQEIQKALHSAMQGRTTFIIAHRISAVKSADQIIVLDGQRIMEQGTHAELLTHGGQYRRIFDVQYADRHEVGAGQTAAAAKGAAKEVAAK